MQLAQGHGRTHDIVLVEAAFGCILSTKNSGTHFNLHCVMVVVVVVVVVVAVVMVVHVHMRMWDMSTATLGCLHRANPCDFHTFFSVSLTTHVTSRDMNVISRRNAE